MKENVRFVVILLATLSLAVILAACSEVEVPSIEILATDTLTPVPPTPTSTATPTPSPTPTPAPLIQAPADGVPDHDLEIVLDYDNRRLDVVQKILLQNNTSDTWQEVVLFIPPAHQPEIFNLRSVEVTTEWAQQGTTATLEGIILYIQLPIPVEPGEPVKVRLAFGMEIPPVSTSSWPPVGNFGAGDRVIQAGDWHPALVPYTEREGWQTWTYHPVGDPVAYTVADYDVRIMAPAGITLAGAGALPEDGAVRHFVLEKARSFAFLASPDYQKLTGWARGIPVESYFLPEYGEAGQAVIDIANSAITHFETLYGSYPYEGLVVAQNAYYGGMEYSGLVSMSSYAYETHNDSPYSLLTSLTVHEIAHQWWYGAVGNDQVHEPWLDESFAKYSEVLFYEHYYPGITGWWWENHVNYWDPSGPLDSTIYDYNDTPTYLHNLYGQGALFLSDLRDLMGDEAFFAFVQDYRNQYESKMATKSDFFNAARVHTDVDLTSLLQAYFAAP